MLLMSIRWLASSGFVREGRARRFVPVVVAAATTPAESSSTSAIRMKRGAFIPTPPWVRCRVDISEVRAHTEPQRARDAEQARTLRRECVGGVGIDALRPQLRRHGAARLGVEEAGGVRRAGAGIDRDRVV